MSSAATSKSAAWVGRALALSAAVLAGAVALFGGAGGASAMSLATCTTTVSAPTASPSEAPAGTQIAYTATVTAGTGCTNGSPTGTVAFYTNFVQGGVFQSYQIGSAVTLQPSGTAGQATATLNDSSLPAGTYSITASYTPADGSFQASGPSAGTTVIIDQNTKNTTVMSFTLSPSTLVVGQFVTFDVKITAVDANGNPTGTIPTGTVHFSAGPTAGSGQVHFASVNLDSTGSLTFQYGGFVPGDYIVIASYTGDPSDNGISGQLPLTVLPAANPVATSTTVVASPSSISTGDSTTLNAHVVETATQSPPPVGGTVDFYAGPTSTNVVFEGSGTLDANGNAQLTVGNFTSGAYVVRAQYLGDGGNVQGSSGDNTLLVSATSGSGGGGNATQTAYTGSLEATVGSVVTLSGHLQIQSGSPLSGKPLTLTLGSQSCVTAATIGSGNASCTITLAQAPGQYTVTAAFLGDSVWAASSGSSTFTVDKGSTAIAYNGDTSAAYGSTATLAGTLTDSGGNPIAGETVHFAMGTQSCDGVTDSSGHASCTITVTQAPSTYSVSASFSGDATYTGSGAAEAPFTVTALPTTTTYTGDTHGVQGTKATLSAHVTGVPDGATVSFTVGSAHCAGTASGGNASCQVTLTDAPGTGYTVTATYAGDSTHLGSSDSKPFTIFAPTTTTHIASITPALAGSTVTLQATVSPSAASGTVTFSSGGTTLCTGTLSGGTASCSASFASTGSYTVTAHYNGDGLFPTSQDATTVLVYAFAPGGGTFVVGDKSASGSVSFWGSQWWKSNVLSGGAAPSSFKGFALNLSAPKCGATWSTDPGNSSPPAAGPLPAYMAVVVTSKSTQSGSQISGNVVAIVIVKTNGGYMGDPGHAGTGTVVATLCG